MQHFETAATWLARLMALMGGAALLALVILTVISVSGRSLIFLGLGPVPGDFELVEAGTAFAVFAFLPWCQITRGHAAVEIFANRLGTSVNAAIEFLSDLVYLVLWTWLMWRLWLGLSDKMAYGETTFIIQFPIWWAYAAAFAAGCIGVLVAVFCTLRSARGIVGRPVRP